MKESSKMNVTFALDDNYLLATAVAMTSLLVNNRGEVNLYILSVEGHLSEPNKEILRGVAESYSCDITFADVPISALESFPSGRQGLSMYLRLFAPQLFPHIDKLLYLDGDIIVNESIRELYDIDIERVQLAGVTDRASLTKPHLDKIGFPYKRDYINTGVLLMNLRALRELDIVSMVNSYVDKYGEVIKYGDQDTINCIFPDILSIHPKFNTMQTIWLINGRSRNKMWSKEQIKQARRSPVIIHYLFRIKPWHAKCSHLHKGLWYHYLAMTQYKDFRPQKLDNIFETIKYGFKYISKSIIFKLTS